MQSITNQQAPATPLFQHVARPEWGLGVLAWQRADKRGFQFQDGQLRIFKTGFLDLLRPVDRPVDESARLLADLSKMIGRRRAAKRIDPDTPNVSFSEQLDYFRALFPKGFQGVNWAKKYRGIGATKRLKRHRNPVIQEAAELLGVRQLEAHLDPALAPTMVDQMRRLVDSTELVTKSAGRRLDRIEPIAAEQLVRNLAALLVDDSDVAATFDPWVAALTRALDRKPSWAQATAWPALARPDRFTAVKQSTYARAAAWLAPSLVIEEVPSGNAYQRILAMTVAATGQLETAGLRPRDRLDVYDFIQVTLCPNAIKTIAARRCDEGRARPAEGQQDHAAA